MTQTQQAFAAPSRASSTVTRAQDGVAGDVKVVYIIDRLHYDLGGTEGQVMKLVRGLGPRMPFELIVLRDGPWIREQVGKPGLNITVIDMSGGVRTMRFWRAFGQLIRHLKASRASVVHTFFPIANILGAVAARLAGIRTVVGSRRDYGYWMSPAYLFFTKLSNRLVSRIVTNSPEVKRFTVEKEGFDADRIDVIYNALDLGAVQVERPDLALKQQIGIPVDHRVVALVANYRPIKRQDTLVKAMEIVRAQRDDVSALLIGDPNDPYRPEVDAFVANSSVSSNVFMAHAKGNIAQYLSFIDVGCNCSESEGLSNAVMEYMAAGIPCVVSDGGGNKDLIVHEKNGLVFPVGDHRALATQILRLLGDPALRTACVQASSARIRDEMSLPVIIDTFERFYRRIAR